MRCRVAGNATWAIEATPLASVEVPRRMCHSAAGAALSNFMPQPHQLSTSSRVPGSCSQGATGAAFS
eukprot:1804560-Pyramimonas_sp.AAC.1